MRFVSRVLGPLLFKRKAGFMRYHKFQHEKNLSGLLINIYRAVAESIY
jgi:hypothetical protein